MILTPVLTVRTACSGTRAGSLMTVGPMHEETETATTIDDEGYELMLQVNDPVSAVKECSSMRVMRHTR